MDGVQDTAERLPRRSSKLHRGLARRYICAVETALIAGMAVVVVLAALQVFFRYVVGSSLSWSEEALRYLIVWIASLGVGLAYARYDMIGMTLILSRLPRRLAIGVALLGRLLIIALVGTIAWYGFQFAWQTRAAQATALPISMFWVHLSITTAGVLVVIHAASGISSALVGRTRQSTAERSALP